MNGEIIVYSVTFFNEIDLSFINFNLFGYCGIRERTFIIWFMTSSRGLCYATVQTKKIQ
jgi:hypothetical protein